MNTKIYTRTGDSGETSLVGGSRISKSSRRVEAYGAIDETNAFVGAALAITSDSPLRQILEFVMHKLFNCSSVLAHPAHVPATVAITPENVTFIEKSIDSMEAATGPSRGFVLPTGCPLAAQLHMARTVCRRSERRLFALNAEEPVDENVLCLINRTSDLLFAASRYANYLAQLNDIPWNSSR